MQEIKEKVIDLNVSKEEKNAGSLCFFSFYKTS